MLAKGYAFDLISDNQLQKVMANGSQLQTPGGAYRTIVLANTKYLPLPTLQKLADLAKGRCYHSCIQQFSNRCARLWPTGRKTTTVYQYNRCFGNLLGRSALQKATTGKGAFIKRNDISALLQAANVFPEPMYKTGLQCIRRSIPGGNYYFISNATKNAVAEWVPLSRKAASAIQFDPMLGQSGVAKTRIKNNKLEVLVQLEPGESRVLQTSNKTLTGKPYTYYTAAGKGTEMKGNWRLFFMMGGPDLPKPITITKLGSWTRFPNR